MNLKRAFLEVFHFRKSWLYISIIFILIEGSLPYIQLSVNNQLINSTMHILLGERSNHSQLLYTISLLAAVTIFSSLLNAIKGIYNKFFEMNFDLHLQKKLYQNLNYIPQSQFDNPDFQNHLNRVNSSVAAQFMSPINSFLSLVQGIIVLISFMIYLLAIHWILVLLSVLFVCPFLFWQIKLGKGIFSLHVHQSAQSREVFYLKNILSDRNYAKELKIFQLQDYFVTRWVDKYSSIVDQLKQQFKKESMLTITQSSIKTIAYSAISYILILLLKQRHLPIGSFVTAGMAVQGVQNCSEQIVRSISSLYQETLYITDYYRFMDIPRINDPEKIETVLFPKEIKKGIIFNNVSFSYPNSTKKVLENINLSIGPYQKIAIIGINGSGKTTLIKCLLGLYHVTEGSITIDGININNIDRDSLYENMSVLFQDFNQYPYSVRENIGFGNIERIDDFNSIEMISRKVGLHETIDSLPEGYETNLGRMFSLGEDLSGGQWQKVAIARLLYKKAKIRILDEPTAALDPRAEFEILTTYNNLSKDCISIIISHRLYAATLADKVVVLKDGRIKEEGTHEELLQVRGEYYRLFQLQNQLFNDKQVKEGIS